MDDNKRPKHSHFWIPDEQVVQKEYVPTGRSKPRSVHHSQHGQVLLRGLRDVEDFHGGLSSPWADKLIVFKVEFAPGYKVQNPQHQEFLRGKGLDIVAVRNRSTLLAATSPMKFKRLKDKVSEYQVRGVNADFQYLESFSSFQPDDKHAEGLRQLLSQPVVPDKPLDVQIILLPRQSRMMYDEALKYLSERIREDGGELVRSPYRLSDDTPVMRALVPSGALGSITQEELVYRVEETEFFQILDPLTVPDNIVQAQIDPSLVPENLPIVAVLDSGVRFDYPQLDQLVIRRWTAPGIAMANPSHGTGVASRVMFGDQLEIQAAAGVLTPRCRIADGCISDGQGMSQDQLIERLRGSVEDLHPFARIFNLSFNSRKPIEGDVQSLLGYELDMLTHKYDIQFVISAGNHDIWRLPDVTLGDILEDSDSFVSPPADSLLALTVGSISRANAPGSVSQRDDPSPFSRRGPGFTGNPKPDVTAPGGNIYVDQTTGELVVPPQAAAYALAPGAKVMPTCGTSFSAPVVAGDLAVVHHALPMNNLLLSKVLLLHTAEVFWDDEGLNDLQKELYANVYGTGLSRPDRAMLSTGSSVTFLRTGELNRLTKERVKFRMPAVLAAQKGRNTARVQVTCLTLPPLDRSKGTGYCCAYVDASLHKVGNQPGTLPSSNPSGSEGRQEWQPYQHFDKLFSKLNPGDWEVWLQLWTRWDVADDQNVPYALAITVEDPSGAVDVYTAISQEVGNQYTPVNRLRARPGSQS